MSYVGVVLDSIQYWTLKSLYTVVKPKLNVPAATERSGDDIALTVTVSHSMLVIENVAIPWDTVTVRALSVVEPLGLNSVIRSVTWVELSLTIVEFVAVSFMYKPPLRVPTAPDTLGITTVAATILTALVPVIVALVVSLQVNVLTPAAVPLRPVKVLDPWSAAKKV